MKNILKNLQKKDIAFILISFILIIGQVWLELKIPEYSATLSRLITLQNVQMKDILYNGGMMLLCALTSLASAIICGYFISKIAASISKNLRQQIFEKVESFSSENINHFSTASLITRSTNDVVQIQNFVAMGLQMLIKSPVLAIGAILKISSTSLQWTLATVIVVASIIVVVGVIVLLCLPRFKKIQKLTDDLNKSTRENIIGVRVVRAFNAEDYQTDKFEKVNSEITTNNLFTSRITGVMMPFLRVAMNGLVVVIYWISAYLINDIPLTSLGAAEKRASLIGEMTAFSSYAMQIIMSFMMLIMMFIILPRVIISVKRINEVLTTKSKIVDGDIECDEIGEIEFKNVNFSYPTNNVKVLKNISFKIDRGQTVAIIGSTGSGKTTIVDLIMRFYDCTSGEILIDGHNIKEYSITSLMEKIGLATQKAVLFKGTIKENVAYGKKLIDEEKVQKALEVASAKDFASNIDSRVAQGGTNFSGGQKQRISIARALYKNANIYIFDDTFSALDYKTDKTVRQAIKNYAKEATLLIVAQRIGTIKNADKIIVLDEGKIVGVGTHQQLLQNCSIYKDIALSQLSKEEL